jgi:hypothetical protein
MNQHELEQWIRDLPKVELHLHIEGTLEPELLFDLAKWNGLSLRFSGSEGLKRAYNFEDLQAFLDLYYEGSRVLLKERDFFDLTGRISSGRFRNMSDTWKSFVILRPIRPVAWIFTDGWQMECRRIACPD